MANKQVYIPSIQINGTRIEEIGSEADRIVYPGTKFTLELTAEDFDNPEDYHTVWIKITEAVKKKLGNEAS